jgi:hypothetical protein
MFFDTVDDGTKDTQGSSHQAAFYNGLASLFNRGFFRTDCFSRKFSSLKLVCFGVSSLIALYYKNIGE